MALSPGVNLTDRETVGWPPSGAEIKSPIHVHCLDGGNHLLSQSVPKKKEVNILYDTVLSSFWGSLYLHPCLTKRAGISGAK